MLSFAVAVLAALLIYAAFTIFPARTIKDFKMQVDVAAQSYLVENRYTEWITRLDRELALDWVRPFLFRRGDGGRLRLHRAKARLARLAYLERTENWSEYYRLEKQDYVLARRDFEKLLEESRSDGVALEGAYLDWRVSVLQNRMKDAQLAVDRFKRIIALYLHETKDFTTAKTYVDKFADVPNMAETIYSLYALQMKEMLASNRDSSALRPQIESFVDDALVRDNENFLRSAVDAYLPALMSQLDSDSALDAMRSVVEKLERTRRTHEEEIAHAPERYLELTDSAYLYDVMARAATGTLKRHPTHPKSDYFLRIAGRAYYESGDWSKAKEFFEKLLLGHPRSVFYTEALHYVEGIYSTDGDSTGSYERLLKAAYAAHSDAEVAPQLLAHLAFYYENHARPQEALERWNIVLTRFPDTKWASVGAQSLASPALSEGDVRAHR